MEQKTRRKERKMYKGISIGFLTASAVDAERTCRTGGMMMIGRERKKT